MCHRGENVDRSFDFYCDEIPVGTVPYRLTDRVITSFLLRRSDLLHGTPESSPKPKPKKGTFQS